MAHQLEYCSGTQRDEPQREEEMEREREEEMERERDCKERAK